MSLQNMGKTPTPEYRNPTANPVFAPNESGSLDSHINNIKKQNTPSSNFKKSARTEDHKTSKVAADLMRDK